MFKSIMQLLKRPFCGHMFQHSRSRPGWIVCKHCRLYRRG